VASKLIITLKRGLAGKEKSQIATCKALGLGKTNSSVEQPDNDSIRGMINKVAHLVAVTEV
jgi:large subunit ribosomal protein L30